MDLADSKENCRQDSRSPSGEPCSPWIDEFVTHHDDKEKFERHAGVQFRLSESERKSGSNAFAVGL
jgi:hypothetical protein